MITNPDDKNALKKLRLLALWSTRSIVLLVLTGGAVRLTGSGLGCWDWPTCSKNSFTAPMQLHPMIEDSNRFFSTAVSILLFITFLAALRVGKKRKDLVILAGALFGGIIAQALIGGLVVFSHLYPPFVMFHFVLTLLMLANGIILHHRCRPLPVEPVTLDPKEASASRKREVKIMAYGAMALTMVVIAFGTAVSGAGPHPGYQNSKRLPISFATIAEIHAGLVWALVGLSIGTYFAFRMVGVPHRLQKWTMYFVEALLAQGVVGYSQYWLHDPGSLVEIHLLGASIVFSIAVKLQLVLIDCNNSLLDIGQTLESLAF